MHKSISLLFFLLFWGGLSYGQQKTHKETKILQKEIPFKASEKLIISGERTFLKLRSWDKPFIQATVEVISRHAEQAQAKKDLEFITVLFDKKGKTHTYSNALQLERGGEKPKSSLKINLELYIPQNAAVEIENHFGRIDIEGMYKSLKSNSEFTTVKISNFTGKGEWTSRYGDATLSGCQGEIAFNANRSNLVLKKIKADLKVDINYGELEYYYSEPIYAHSIRARYSPLNLFLPKQIENPIDIKCQHCDIVSNNDPLILNKNEVEALFSATISPGGKGPKGIIYSELEDVTVHFEN